jgi:hypothetical protein
VGVNRLLEVERWPVEFANPPQEICSPLGETQRIEFNFKSPEQRFAVLETLQTTITPSQALRVCALHANTPGAWLAMVSKQAQLD